MQISELSVEAVPDAVSLWDRVGLTRPWNDPFSDAKRALRGQSSTILSGWIEENLAATAMVGHDGHRGWLYYVAVEPSMQGNGLGQKIMQEAATWLGTREVPKVQLMVRAENAAVVRFYEQLGYEDQNVVVLGKRL